MTKLSAAALHAYKRRARVLRRLGFASYEEYLASPLWAAIRLAALKKWNKACYACAEITEDAQVHHGDYQFHTLRGPTVLDLHTGKVLDRILGDMLIDTFLEVARLYVVCNDCHRWAEFFLGEKLGPLQATMRLQKRRRERLEAEHDRLEQGRHLGPGTVGQGGS